MRIVRVSRRMSENGDVVPVKTFRLHLPVIDTAHIDELLQLVTGVEGVVGALVEPESATLHVVVSRAASALLVREQLLSVAA